MKIQELSIIFIIIILPISIALSAYTQFQIETLNLQTLYDQKLTAATFDAIKAFQINTANSTSSDLANSKIRDIEASVSTFKNSLKSAFGLNGYSEEELNSYVPALVYTMYDGFYIYSAFRNTNYLYDNSGNPIDNNGEVIYGLQPYITYSCRYVKGNIDVVITYCLDNYITIEGTIDGGNSYFTDEGYLIDGISRVGDQIWYNGIPIKVETDLKEYVGSKQYPYVKINGTKYYYDDNNTPTTSDDQIFYLANGSITVQGEYKGDKAYQYYENNIKNNTEAIQYYQNAMEFTEKVKNRYKLGDLKYSDALNTDGNKIWAGDNRTIFEFNNDTTKPEKNIECKSSNFNQHRLAVIRKKIEENLSLAIANYNSYSKLAGIEFQMPQLSEEEWDLVMNNISLISFVQGLNIGGKIYNGYTIVNNTESKEVVQEENIYILGTDGSYHKIGDNYLTQNLGNAISGIEQNIPSGRLNLDFKRKSLLATLNGAEQTYYYYPLRDYDASYNSIVTQNNVTTFDDIYQYVYNTNEVLKSKFYTALGRERIGKYSFSNINKTQKNVLIVGYTQQQNLNYETQLRGIANSLNNRSDIRATYIYTNLDSTSLLNYVRNYSGYYDLIIIDSFAWTMPLSTSDIEQLTSTHNLITISNDAVNLPIMKSSVRVSKSTEIEPYLTSTGSSKIGFNINKHTDGGQSKVEFVDDAIELYRAKYRYPDDPPITLPSGEIVIPEEDVGGIAFWRHNGHNWIHSAISLSTGNLNVIDKLVTLAIEGL